MTDPIPLAPVSPAALYGAPIRRYEDARLYGTRLTNPFRNIYAYWIRPLTNPIHPETNKVVEIGRRTLSACAGAIVILIFSIIPLLGKIAQIIHYHSLSEDERMNPKAVTYQGMYLPSLEANPHRLSTDRCYGGTFKFSERVRPDIEGSLRSGKLQRNYQGGTEFWAIEGRIAPDIYLSEIAIVKTDGWFNTTDQLHRAWDRERRPDQDSPEFRQVVSELFRLNGFKGINYSRGGDGWDPLFYEYLSVEKFQR